MNESQNKRDNLTDTTDCLEAVGVFKGWKNLLFAITVLCLLMLQGAFWLVNTSFVKTADTTKCEPSVVEDQGKDNTSAAVATETDKIEQAAKTVALDINQPAQSQAQKPKKQRPSPLLGIKIKFEQLALLIRFLNFVLILAAVFYCLTMLFSLKVSMMGRLGGINHIARAFFLSLAFLVLLVPWQLVFAGAVAGAMYTPQELLSCSAAAKDSDIFSQILYYLRFTGYWLLVLLLLIFSQLRSARWAKATLRRLEIV